MPPSPQSNLPFSARHSQLRQHYYLPNYVIVAPSRNDRPDNYREPPAPHKQSDSEHCPFCHLIGATLYAAPTAKAWEVKVIPNGYPALSLDNPAAYGAMEVVVETPDHEPEFSDLPLHHIELILKAYITRLAVLKATPGIRYVTVFKNDGPLGGTSIAHAHSQIIALPLIPPKIEAERDALNHYADTHGSCAICDLTTWERDKNERIIASDSHITTLALYAPSHPYEAWIIPRRHIGSLAELNGSELRAVARQLKHLTSRLDAAMMSYNLILQESLPDQPHHLILKIEPRLPRFYAGAELGTGIVITAISPEAAARWYTA